MGDYGGDDRGTSMKIGYLRWPLLIGAALIIATIYAVLPADNSGPNSVTVVGVTAPRPAFGSYPGLRVPVKPRPQIVADYRT
jgi:hypothetical protein